MLVRELKNISNLSFTRKLKYVLIEKSFAPHMSIYYGHLGSF